MIGHMDQKTPELTDRQKQVLTILHNAITHRGVVPTFQEIQDEFGFKSSRGVVCHLMALEKRVTSVARAAHAGFDYSNMYVFSHFWTPDPDLSLRFAPGPGGCFVG